MLAVGNVKLNQFWIEKNHLITYEVISFQKEFDFETGKMYRVVYLENLVTGYIIGVAENIFEKRFELDLYSQRQNRKEVVA